MRSMPSLRKVAFPGTALLLALVLAVSQVARSQAPIGVYAKTTAVANPSVLKAGGHGAVLVTVTIAPGFHINSVKPADPNLIPTKLAMSKLPGFSFGQVSYPPNKTVKESYSPKPMLVYTGKTVIRVPVTATSAKPGHYTLTGSLSFQGCNHSACFPPMTSQIRAAVTVK